MTTDKGRRVAAGALFVAGAVCWVWGVAYWFEPLIWERGLNTIATGILLWCLAMAAAPDHPGLFRRAGRLAERAGRDVGIDLSTPVRRFSALGTVSWAMVSAMLSMQYLYLLRYWAAQAAFTVLAAVAGGLVHALAWRANDRLLMKFYPGSEWRRSAGAWGLLGLGWSAALWGLFDHWEALATDPLGRQLLISAGAALALGWLGFGRYRGPAGRVHRRAAVVAAALALSYGGWEYHDATTRTTAPRLRVLLLTLDTTRADYLSCYGYPRQTSPHLDALARSGVRFTRAFSQAGLTDPSHASILTGTYPRTHGLNSNLHAVTGKVPSLAEHFLERGFVTAAVGSRDHVTPQELNVAGFSEASGVRRWMGQAFAPEAFRRAANSIYRHRDQDLFLWVHFFDPHESYQPHPGYSDHFYGRDRGKRNGKLHLKQGQGYSPEEIQYFRDLYAGEIFYMDFWIGRLLQFLEAMEPRPEQPPLIAVIADHGEFMGEYQNHPERLGFGHGPIYNPGVHVPLILSWPGVIPPGTVVESVVQGIDLAPTLAGYALGIDYPGQGQNLRPAIEGQAGKNYALITHCRSHDRPTGRYDAMYALIDQDFKYTITYRRDGELFDLSSDWAEAWDLSAALPDRAARMLNDWEQWMRDTPESKPDDRVLDRSERRALKALGYIE